MPKVQVPCYNGGRGCYKRTQYCHAHCSEWDEYVKAKDAEREKVNAKKALDTTLDDFAAKQTQRVRLKQQADHATRKRWGICAEVISKSTMNKG